MTSNHSTIQIENQDPGHPKRTKHHPSSGTAPHKCLPSDAECVMLTSWHGHQLQFIALLRSKSPWSLCLRAACLQELSSWKAEAQPQPGQGLCRRTSHKAWLCSELGKDLPVGDCQGSVPSELRTSAPWALSARGSGSLLRGLKNSLFHQCQ